MTVESFLKGKVIDRVNVFLSHEFRVMAHLEGGECIDGGWVFFDAGLSR